MLTTWISARDDNEDKPLTVIDTKKDTKKGAVKK